MRLRWRWSASAYGESRRRILLFGMHLNRAECLRLCRFEYGVCTARIGVSQPGCAACRAAVAPLEYAFPMDGRVYFFQQHQGMRLSWYRTQGKLTANCAKRDRFREVHASRVLHAGRAIYSAIGLRS